MNNASPFSREMNMDEQWKLITIKDFLPKYEVSTFGNVRNILTGKEIKKSNQYKGYLVVNLRTSTGNRNISVHRLVLLTFRPIDDTMQVNHIDGNKKNNMVENLEWCTPKQNTQHALKTGLHDLYGEKCYASKLTTAQAIEIKSDTLLTYRELGKKYGIDPKAAWFIKNGKTWKHI